MVPHVGTRFFCKEWKTKQNCDDGRSHELLLIRIRGFRHPLSTGGTSSSLSILSVMSLKQVPRGSAANFDFPDLNEF